MVTYRVDWPRLLADIAYLLGDVQQATGAREPVGRRRLSEATGYPHETLRNWIEGATPKHHDGEALIERWCVMTGKPREFVPIDRSPALSAHDLMRRRV